MTRILSQWRPSDLTPPTPYQEETTILCRYANKLVTVSRGERGWLRLATEAERVSMIERLLLAGTARTTEAAANIPARVWLPCTMSDYMPLGVTGKTLRLPESNDYFLCGWLSPDGEFFPCGWYEHDTLADVLAPAGCGTHELELGKWLRINNGKPHNETTTDEQALWLLERS